MTTEKPVITTLLGVHGINCLQRHDEAEVFGNDEEAQAYVVQALQFYARHTEDNPAPTMEQALQHQREAQETYERAEAALDTVLKGKVGLLCTGRYSFEKYEADCRGGLRVHIYSADYGSEWVDLTKEDLQADDPVQAHLDRKEAEREAASRKSHVQTLQNRKDALVAQLAAMTPEARAEVLAAAEGKA